MDRPDRLSATFVRTVTTPGRYGDGRGGHGLSLLVKPSSKSGLSKTWAQRLATADGLIQVGLGAYPAVTLEAARERAFDQARALRAGTLTAKDRAVPVKAGRHTRHAVVPTFSQAAEHTIATHAPSWRNPRTADHWRSRLTAYAYPALGDMPVAAITAADIFGVLSPVWHSRREQARKVRQHIHAVLAWSIAQGHRRDNPADSIGSALPRAGAKVQHFAALPYADIPAALARVDASDAYEVTKLAIRFLTLTAARSGEVRGAHWDEIDGDTWTIPASRMKAGLTHRIPLSAAALDVLNLAREYADSSGLISPSPTGRVLSDNTLSKLFRDLGIAGTIHGMRSAFRDWAAEAGVDRTIAELALAHIEGSATVRAYRRTDLFEARRAVMEAWGQAVSVRDGSP